jgi:hypothetical protein
MNEWSSYELNIILPTDVERNTAVPDLTMDDLDRAPLNTGIVRKTLQAAMITDVIGEEVKPENAFPRGHQAVEELSKMLQPATVQQPYQLELTLMKRSGRAGSWAVKQIEKAGGSIEEGLRRATEVFEDRCTQEERILLARAIEAVDLGAWLKIFQTVFAKG